MSKKRPVVLMILDGWGFRDAAEGNAIALANTPIFDQWRKDYERSLLDASGEAVGLTDGQMGNSEVGHLNIGAGRIVYQDISKIDHDIKTGEFLKNKILVDAAEYIKKTGKHLHLFGLFGPGGVHSHNRHLFALIEMAQKHDIIPILHLITDGRDTPPNSAIEFLSELENFLIAHPAIIATISGRYYSMDRDKRWERTQLAYDAYVHGKGLTASSAHEAIRQSYDANVADEFIKPTIIQTKETGDLKINEGDCLLFFNFRADRMRQIVKSFALPDFDSFERGQTPGNLHIVTFTEYETDLPVNIAFPKENVKLPLAEVVSMHGLKQFHAAETEKYSHVTFFLNGGREEPFPGEERKLIPSPKVATYDLKPEMSAYELADAVIDRLHTTDDDLVVVNFANLDMVGHTGILEAGIKAAETVDECAGKVLVETLKKKGIAIITADHGNAEMMYDRIRQEPHTYHSTNLVQFYIIGDLYYRLRPLGSLQDIAPTILQLMGLPQPEVMTGRSLIEEIG